MTFETEPFRFKFHWLDENGNQKGMFRKKGLFDNDTLTLEDVELPAAVIYQTQVFENRMAMTVPSDDGQFGTVMIMPSSKSVTDRLRKRIDISRSRAWAQHHKEQLEEAGRGAAYRDEVCPDCTATVVVSDMDKTPQVYCHFCDSLSTIDQNPPQGESKLGLCEECGMYSQPQRFTIFYFYFLIVFYGFSSRKALKCRACMRSDAWKMFFGNLIFILGVPSAVYQLIRSYSGGSIVEGGYAGLNAANIAARKQNWAKATDGYRKVLDNIGVSAGVKYNLGLALRSAGDDENAARSFEVALSDCSNYAPAYAHLVELYPKLGETDRLAALKEQWEDADQESAESGDGSQMYSQIGDE